MRSLLVLLAAGSLSPLYAGGLRAQNRLSDPFDGGQQAIDSPRGSAFERKAWTAANLLPGFASTIATRQFGSRPIAFVRGWTAGGTGAGQVSYLAYELMPSDSIRLVWSAPAYEYARPPERVWVAPGKWQRIPDRPYEMHSCLYVTDDGRLAFAARRVPKRRAFDGPPLPPPGYYRWSESEHRFRRVAAADSILVRTCRREPDSEYQ